MSVRPLTPAATGLRFFEGGTGLPPGLAIANHRLGLVEGAACLRQSLVTLLSTRPGERVMRPLYGCDLDAIAFAPMGPTTFMLARLIVEQAVTRFESRVILDGIDVIEDPRAPAHLLLTLRYRERGAARTGPQTLALQVPTEPLPSEDTP